MSGGLMYFHVMRLTRVRLGTVEIGKGSDRNSREVRDWKGLFSTSLSFFASWSVGVGCLEDIFSVRSCLFPPCKEPVPLLAPLVTVHSLLTLVTLSYRMHFGRVRSCLSEVREPMRILWCHIPDPNDATRRMSFCARMEHMKVDVCALLDPYS